MKKKNVIVDYPIPEIEREKNNDIIFNVTPISILLGIIIGLFLFYMFG